VQAVQSQPRLQLPYAINDADNHFVEPEDMYERYIEPRFRGKAVRFVTDERGQRIQLFGSRPSKLGFTRESAPRSEQELEALAKTVAPPPSPKAGGAAGAGGAGAGGAAPTVGDGGARSPGMFLNRLNPYKGLDEEERKRLIRMFKEQEAAWGDRDARLALMDEQGIHAALMFPGHVLSLEFEFADDVDAIHANAQAYNRWIYDEVGYAYCDRMFLPPYIALADVDLAVAEVERVIAEGARVVGFIAGHAHGGRAKPSGGRSIADPCFDPVWARLDEAGVRVATHVGPTDYAKYGADLSEDPDAVLGDFDGLQYALYWGDRPAMDTVACMIMHGLFDRFPGIRVCLAEQGTPWLPYLLRRLDHVQLMGRGARWGRLDRRPSEIFREHFVIAPFPEENVARVIAEVGIEPIVFGSDFPHGEGLAFPAQYAEAQLADLPEDQVRAIMRDNLAGFLGLPDA
jgi:predicted TIM-barrel fold metal-dependent hydrolase